VNERERVQMRTSADDAEYAVLGGGRVCTAAVHTYRDKGGVIVSVAGVVQ